MSDLPLFISQFSQKLREKAQQRYDESLHECTMERTGASVALAGEAQTLLDIADILDAFLK